MAYQSFFECVAGFNNATIRRLPFLGPSPTFPHSSGKYGADNYTYGYA
jgi:hypothetical protein